MEHTQGPWIDDGNEIGVEITIGEDVTFIPVCTIMMPGLYNTTDKIMEEEANKRLILAAPDLLEACRMALRLLLQIDDGEDYTTRTINDLSAALARAEGGDDHAEKTL